MTYKVSLNGKTYEVEVEQGEAKMISVTDAALAAPAPAAPVAAAAAPVPAAAPAPAAVTGGEAVKAPMPGTIMRINVTVGQAIKKNEVVIILEAMKMENEISSPIDGVVKQILVAKGALVESGTPLIVLE